MIERLARTGRAVAGLDGSVHDVFPVAVSPAEGEVLRAWVMRERAALTIEIGLGYAISTLFMCDGLLANDHDTVRHVAIDPHQTRRFSNCGLQLLEEAGVAEMVEHHAQPSQLVLPRLLEEGRRFDFAFVDGNHRFDGVFVDLVFLGQLVRPGGVVALDDFDLPAVSRAASFFVRNLGWTVAEVSAPDESHQWAVLRTPTAPDHRPFDHFVEF